MISFLVLLILVKKIWVLKKLSDDSKLILSLHGRTSNWTPSGLMLYCSSRPLHSSAFSTGKGKDLLSGLDQAPSLWQGLLAATKSRAPEGRPAGCYRMGRKVDCQCYHYSSWSGSAKLSQALVTPSLQTCCRDLAWLHAEAWSTHASPL